MFCEDPLVKFFRDEHRISLVKEPNTGIKLLDIYEKKDKMLHKVGYIDDLFESKRMQLPKEGKVKKEGNVFSLTQTGKIKREYALKPLSFFIQALGGILSAGFESKFQDNHNFEFFINNPQAKEIPKIQVEEYLNYSKLKIKNKPGIEKSLEDGKLYIILTVLRTNSFSMSIADDNNNSLDLEAGIKEVISGDVSYQKESTDSKKLSYTGRNYVTFGVLPAKILWDKDTNKFHIDLDYKTPVSRGDSIQVDAFKEDEPLIDMV
jgi:hypothetical protein